MSKDDLLRDDIINRYLVSKLDADGVIRVKAVEMAIEFCHSKEDITPERFAEIYESTYQFLKQQNPPSNG